MALDDLLARLEREAEARGEAILDEARSEAMRIAEEEACELGRRREERLARREAELREELEAELAAARHRARAAVLRARADFLRRTFAAASERLEGDEAAEARRRALPGRLAGALAFLYGPGLVACAPEVEAEARAALSDREDVDVVPDPDVGGGFLVHSADGRLEIDERLTERLRRAQDRLAVEVVARVRGSGADAREAAP